ncbi:MAG TPA: rhodanese-like domain-containing protein [Alphaproteobacteria bacterium]|nr:rhodanese-like domain-containing protein [Alphaproteobacteria bacterium]
MSNVPAIEVEQLRDMMQSAEPPLLIDVREQRENDFCQIPGNKLIPLGELPQHLAELPKDKTIVLHCHHGGRSGRAVAYLMQQGYDKVLNLKGGIHAWSQRIDPSVKEYE